MRRFLFGLLLFLAPTLCEAQGALPMCSPPGSNYPVICSEPGLGNAGYPIGSTPQGGTFSGADTSSASATLPAVAGQYEYICGFTVSGLGATATATVNVTVGTLVGGATPTFVYVFATGATAVDTPLQVTFPTICPRAQTIGTAITVTVPGAAGNTATQIHMYGFSQ